MTTVTGQSFGQEDHLVLEPVDPNGKHIVLVSGDEEYRSEETCPMLAKILSQKHGFKCTVLFAIEPETNVINPNNATNIAHLESLAEADLMIIGTRMRKLPEEQLVHFYEYLNAGKPVIGFRTSTHAFLTGETEGFVWKDFGTNVIGERWDGHHGAHKKQGGRGVIVAENADHPVLNNVSDIFTTSDIYTASNLDEEAATILMRGGVTETLDPSSRILMKDEKNSPMQALIWMRDYQSPNGEKTGRCLSTTAGASVDFRSEHLRRLVVNGSYHLLDMEVPAEADVEFVDPFQPSFYSFMPKPYFLNLGLTPADFALGAQPTVVPFMPEAVEK